MSFVTSKKDYKNILRNTTLGITIFLSALFVFLGPLTAMAFVSVDPIVSRNWSGYVSMGMGSYTGIGASWIVPNASSTVYSADATWVGISGMLKPDLIQVGTHALADKKMSLNAPGLDFTYKAWYEILPNSPVIIPVAIKPGDSIVVSIVRQSSDRWLITFNNVTTNQNYETTVHYASSMSSVEWIQEMPLSTGTNVFVPLDNFGTIHFADTWAIVNGSKKTIGQLNGRRITMLDYSNQPLVTTSMLGLDGASFSVARTNIMSTPALTVGQIVKIRHI